MYRGQYGYFFNEPRTNQSAKPDSNALLIHCFRGTPQLVGLEIRPLE
jgi:hypothetical protein